MKIEEGFTYGELASLVQPSFWGHQPERLKKNPALTIANVPLIAKRAYAAISLMLLPILTADEGVKMPYTADVWTACFDALMLAVRVLTLDENVQLLATKGRYLDADIFSLEKTTFC